MDDSANRCSQIGMQSFAFNEQNAVKQQKKADPINLCTKQKQNITTEN